MRDIFFLFIGIKAIFILVSCMHKFVSFLEPGHYCPRFSPVEKREKLNHYSLDQLLSNK